MVTEHLSETPGATGVQYRECNNEPRVGGCTEWLGFDREAPIRLIDERSVDVDWLTVAFRNFWPGTVMNYQIILQPIQ